MMARTHASADQDYNIKLKSLLNYFSLFCSFTLNSMLLTVRLFMDGCHLIQVCSCCQVWDATASDPKLLVYLKSYRNTVPVPRHWCQKRKFLQVCRLSALNTDYVVLVNYFNSCASMLLQKVTLQTKALQFCKQIEVLAD